MKNILSVLFTFLSLLGLSQNVAINATGAAPAASAMLDITSTTSGLLIPRMTTAQRTAIAAPATGLKVYDTTTGTFWYFNGIVWVQILTSSTGWALGGNTLTGTELMGSNNAQPVRFFCNGLERFRINPTDGEVIVGATTSGLPGDMLSAVSNLTLPWAVNGYSGQNGAGVYGAINAGNATVFGAVQGEYSGTNIGGVGVRGSYLSGGAGTAFTLNNCRNGVIGLSTVAGSYKFGTYGYAGTSARTGGVMGNDFNLGFGSLGYLSSAFTDHSVYGFGTAFATGVIGGKTINGSSVNSWLTEPSTHVGIGIYGSVMGGWVKGLVYGTNFSGARYGIYVDGKTITNNSIIQLNTTDGDKRVATYMSAGVEEDVQAKGKGTLVNGIASIEFSEDFKQIIDRSKDVIISITPIGSQTTIYIKSSDANGFVAANDNNISASFYWVAIGTRNNPNRSNVSEEILLKEYDANMFGVMHNDYSPTEGLPIWWDGTNIRHDKPPVKERKADNSTNRPSNSSLKKIGK